MIHKISSLSQAFESQQASSSRLSVANAPFSRDSLTTGDSVNFFSSSWGKITNAFHALIGLIKRLFFCCLSSESDANQSLAILKDVKNELQRQIQQVKQGIRSRESLQGWWRTKYDALHHSVRELLLLEDVKLYTPGGENEDKWAKENLERFRPQAIDFVANLYRQTEKNGKIFDPIDDIFNFVSNVINVIEKQ